MINEIFDKYGSDKGTNGHGYGPFYEQWLPDNPKKILEIGVNKGASIRAWKEIFPNAEVHGLDLFILDPIPDIPGAIFWKGNQTDQYMLNQLRYQNFDLIIDDGSHNTRDQLVTFFSLIQENTVYFIEDLHLQLNPFFNTGVPVPLWPSNLLSEVFPMAIITDSEEQPKIMATSCKQWK